MTAKLNLTINESIARRIKKYGERKKTSVSNKSALVGNLFTSHPSHT